MKIPIDLKTGEISGAKPQDIIVGIDLGTTNSLVAYVKDGNPLTIKSSSGLNALTPSIIHFGQDDEIKVGTDAQKYQVSHPESTVFSVKRLMGKSYKDIKHLKSSIGYEIIDEGTDALVKVKVRDRFYTPTELSSRILISLKNDAQIQLNSNISKAVITVPAYFNDGQRQATRDAGKLAGLDVLRIINEPTAACLAYGIGLDRSQVINAAIYDLGGGTFDISVLHIEDGIFEVLSTHGDTSLGGDDIDRVIIAYWAGVHNISPENLEEHAALNQELRLKAEEAKKTLSSEAYFESKVRNFTLKIDRITFENLIQPIITKTLESCSKAIADSALTIDDIDKIILVGGSTRIPAIKNALYDFFLKTPDDSMNPDEVVALGAAIQADILAGNRKDILLLDVTPLSLGIETVGGLMDTIIPRNTKVPQRAGRQYTTSVDGQKNLRISVFQGERDLVEHNRKLGEFTLKNIPPMVAGLPKIEVIFILDADGILTVTAKELRSNTETTVEIKSTYGISEEQMALMLLDSIKNAEEDVRKRAYLESINEANNVILASEKFIVQNKILLSAPESNNLKNLIDALKYEVSSGNKDSIEAAMKNLNDYSSPLAHRALDYNISNALHGKKI
jgi:molecular chaperone HscA